MPLGDLLGRAGVDRRVVDHDAGQPLESAEQPVELGRPVAHRDDDGDVAGAARGAGAGSGVNAPADTRRRASSWAGRRVPDGGAAPPALHQLPGPLGDPEEAERAAPEQHGPAVEFLRSTASSVRVKEPGSGVGGPGGRGPQRRAASRVSLGWATAQSWQSGAGDRLGRCPEEVGMLVEDQDTQDVEELSEEDVDELLVEEVSIDGMCGVY